MRTTRALGLGLAILAGTGTAWAQQAPRPLNLQELLAQLDANGDSTLQRGEIPEAGLPAFETLLTLGDTDHDGQLAPDELRAMGQKLRALGPADPAARALRLRAMDKDGDMRVSRDEFTGPAPSFDRLDVDRDGFLTRREIARPQPPGGASSPPPAKPGAPKGSAPAGAAVLPPRVRVMDKNEDGVISREEFQGRALLFDRLDTNKDGALSPEEVRVGASQIGKRALKKAGTPTPP
jgi:Ca2+-binding EF-hand superfamily protein